jgi:hypothetical protein
MVLSSKKIVIDNVTKDVISEEEYLRLLDMNVPILDDTCLEEKGYVFPITKHYNPNEVSVCKCDGLLLFTKPTTEEEKEKYSIDRCIDFGPEAIKNLKDHITQMDKLKLLEDSRLSIVNNELTLPINEEDTPELKIIKEAINDKHIDADSYKQKFPSDSDFNNDMRALKAPDNNSISFYKAKRVLNAFDIEAELIIRDKKDVINPTGKTYRIILTEE